MGTNVPQNIDSMYSVRGKGGKEYQLDVFFADTKRDNEGHGRTNTLDNADIARIQIFDGKFKGWFEDRVQPVIDAHKNYAGKTVKDALDGVLYEFLRAQKKMDRKTIISFQQKAEDSGRWSRSKLLPASIRGKKFGGESLAFPREKFAANVLQALQRAGSLIESEVQSMILAGASPDNCEATKRRRASRGHDEEPPLNETGQLAASVKHHVWRTDAAAIVSRAGA